MSEKCSYCETDFCDKDRLFNTYGRCIGFKCPGCHSIIWYKTEAPEAATPGAKEGTVKEDYLKWMEEDLQQRIGIKEKEVVRILEELNDQFAFILNENGGKVHTPAGIANDAGTLARFASELAAFDAVRRDLARLHKRPQRNTTKEEEDEG